MRGSFQILLWVILIFVSGTSFGEQSSVTSETLLPKKFGTAENKGNPPHWRYLLHLPEGCKSAKNPWPMILFLHGRSIRGNDLSKVKRYGPPAFLDKKPHFPFVVISPQLPGHSWPTNSLVELLDEVTAKYHVDPARIYLTGVSMGGGGAWNLAAADQKRFAAMAPLCGYGGISLAKKLTDLPIWAFHGQLDKIVPIEPHQKLADAVNKAGGKVRFTVIPDGDHGNIIFPTYKRDDLYQWFLSHRRGKKISPKSAGEYVVKKGDNLWRIGKKHGVSVAVLKKTNGLKSTVLQVGQKLIIPAH